MEDFGANPALAKAEPVARLGPPGFDPGELLKLAERCEVAKGPDTKLDVAIWLAVRADDASLRAYKNGLAFSKKEAAFRASYMMDGFAPTSSLNSAMTLVPEGAAWGVGHGVDHEADNESGWAWCGDNEFPNSGFYYWCATPALALCVAALRARAAQ